MIRLIALAAFAFVLTTPSQAMPLAPVPEQDELSHKSPTDAVQHTSSWCLRGQNHRSPDSSRDPGVRDGVVALAFTMTEWPAPGFVDWCRPN